MANLFDYLFWRGDVDFKCSPFNEIDGLLLSQISYIDFSTVVGNGFDQGISMKDVAKKLKSLPDFDRRSTFSKGINPDTMELFLDAANKSRFMDAKLTGFYDIIDLSKGEQFSAMTYIMEDFSVVVFRGTDGNIVGWKEDCKLGCMDQVPAQKDALDYLQKSSEQTKLPTIIAGHSKGGNLAIYASTKSDASVKENIRSIYNYDGPGFRKDFFESDDYKSIEERIQSFVPQMSIVGMLFCQSKNLKVIGSSGKGAMQHDPLSWQIGPKSFPIIEERDKESMFISTTVNGWINEMSMEQRNQFVEGIFGVLENADIRENDQFLENPLESIKKVLSAKKSMTPETKSTVQKTLQLLFKSGWNNLWGI